MSRLLVKTTVTGLIIFGFAALSGYASAVGTWGKATPVDFSAGVQVDPPNADLTDVSCSTDGNCTAVGQFQNSSNLYIAFAVTSTASNGWGQPVEILFDDIQSSSANAQLNAVSCSSPGNCTAVGRFFNSSNHWEAFTVTSTAPGGWAQARPVEFLPGSQYAEPNDTLEDVSCTSPGNCTAVGQFRNSAGDYEAFTITSTAAGGWALATPVLFGSNVQGNNPQTLLQSVSCASDGMCTAVGTYNTYLTGYYQAFSITSSSAGVWDQAIPVQFNALTQSASSQYAKLQDVSCASAGTCTAVGYFYNYSNQYQGFSVESTLAGGWSNALPVAFDIGAQSLSPYSAFESVSCSSASDCTAVGSFKNPGDDYAGFAVTKSGSGWASGVEMEFDPGVQNTDTDAVLLSVSCVAVDTCTAVGMFYNADSYYEAFVASSAAGGGWAEVDPAEFDSGVQNTGEDAQFNAVSCSSAGHCTAVGNFYDSNGGYQAFIMTQPHSTTPTTTTSTSTTTTTISSTTTTQTTSPRVTTTTTSEVLPSTGSGRTSNWAALGMTALSAGIILVLRRRMMHQS